MNVGLAESLTSGEEVFYAGYFYKVAEIKRFPHGLMIGIYDENNSIHIDYLNPETVNKVEPCYSCQGGGCPVCGGYGRLVI